jgi:outer membrane protein
MTMIRQFSRSAMLALLGVSSTGAFAGEWGLGVGIASQQTPQVGTDPQVFLFPFPSYEGERLSLNFGAGSYALARSESFSLTLEAQLRFDGYDPKDSEELSGLNERDASLDAGLGISLTRDWGVLSLKLLGDTLGVHEGYELSARYEYPFEFGRLTVVPSVGLTLPSDELVTYYYGVRAAEVTSRRQAYRGDAVINPTLGASFSYELSEQWQLIGGGEYVFLGDGITDSPIIERDHELTVFSAIVFKF